MKITYLKGDLTSPRTIELTTFVKELMREKPRQSVMAVREIMPFISPLAGPADAEKVPAVKFSSLYQGDEWMSYTGLVLTEFRHLSSPEEAEWLRKQIVSYSRPLLAFIGLNGQSVKVITRFSLPDGSLPVTREEALRFHGQAYRKAASHYQLQTDRKVTIREPHLDTICRLSWDRNCYFDPEAPVIRMKVSMESPEQLPPTPDPFAKLLPGMKSHQRMEFLFETCLERARSEQGKTWEPEDTKSFQIVLARYCYQSGIPEESAVRWIYYHHYTEYDLPVIRLTVHHVYQKESGQAFKPVVAASTRLVMQTEEFLQRRYDLRKNVINGQVEYREKHTFAFHFKPVDLEVLNGICLEAQLEGMELWDKDIRRYIYSPRVETYNPLQEFLSNLPRWDGEDRIRPLADRVPTEDPAWRERFYKWFLSMVVLWMRQDKIYGNSLVPVLQGGQGISKSVFFRLLLPPALRDYYAESLYMENKKEAELSMAQHVLINLDEFDRLSKKFQAELKNLIQLPVIKIKLPHQKSFQHLRRIASFCATANPEELLSDPTGSRRYICVQVTGPIDISQSLAYDQLYAQAVHAVRSGEQYWLTPKEEQELIESNAVFQQHSLLIDYIFTYFRKPKPEEKAKTYSAPELIDTVKRRSGRTFSHTSARMIGAELKAAGVEKKHTKEGNAYYLIEIESTDRTEK